MNALACELLGSSRSGTTARPGSSGTGRAGSGWRRRRGRLTLTYRRARYRSGASGSSCRREPADDVLRLMMAHCTSGGVLCEDRGMTPSSTLVAQRHARALGDPGRGPGQPVTPRAYRTRRSAPCASASTSATCRWREAAWARFPSTTPGASVEDPLSRPTGERHTEGAARKRSRTYQAAAPRRQDRAIAEGPWRPCRPKPRSSTSGMQHLRTASDHRWSPTGSSPRFSITTPVSTR